MFDTMQEAPTNPKQQDTTKRVDWDQIHQLNGRIEDGWLATIPVGTELAGVLGSLDRRRLSDAAAVEVVKAHDRLVSHFQAQRAEAMVTLVETFEVLAIEDRARISDEQRSVARREHKPKEWAAAELRAALRLNRRNADVQVDWALTITRYLPSLLKALNTGFLDFARTKAFVDGTVHLTNQQATVVVDRLMDEARLLTVGQLKHRIRELCIETNPDDAKERFDQAHQQRRVEIEATEAGTAHLHAYHLAADDAKAVAQALHHHAVSATKAQRLGRNMDQLRADALVSRIAGTQWQRRNTTTGTVDIVVDVRTLAGLTDQPAQLNGYGPVIAEIAQHITVEQTNGTWTYTVVDGDTPITTGTLRRRPTASLARMIRAKQRTCVFPGCATPSTDCDLDHIREYQHGGPTSEDNLAPLCRNDHLLKSTGKWTYQHAGDDYEWTSPLGLRYTTTGRAP